MVCLEELVSEVLSHEGEHQVGSLRIWPKSLSLEKLLHQHRSVRKNSFTCRARSISSFPLTHRVCSSSCVDPTFGSHRQRTVLRYRREETGVVGGVVVGLPAEVSIFGVVGWRAWNKFTSDFGRR